MKVSRASAYGLRALMYMVRHVTQLPATVEAVARTEGMPVDPLGKVLGRLARAGFIQLAHGREKGYVFARPPEEIAPRDLLEPLEGQLTFGDSTPAKHGCSERPEGRCESAEGAGSTGEVGALFEEATIVAAAWKDLERRFGATAQEAQPAKLQIKSLGSKRRPHSEEPRTTDV